MRPLGSFVAGSPASVPACLGMGILVAWAVADGGYAVPTWVPGGLALLALLAVGRSRHSAWPSCRARWWWL
jgi:hypothetical protein